MGRRAAVGVLEERYERGAALLERARRVIPGGVFGHQHPGLLVRGAYPVFLAAADGCRVRDVDGNEYVDFLCGYGPIVLGYRHPKVEEAAEKQRSLGDTMSMPGTAMIELAERLVAITPGAAWATFAKNGSDVCTWAVAVAREATGRELVAMADGAYHGIHGWCNRVHAGFPDSDRVGVRTFEWNDLESLEGVFAEAAGELAAVIVTPIRHEAYDDSGMPAPGFLEGVRNACDRHGAVMIVDDVRAGFRLHLGGSTQCWNVTPDLLLYSKAIANGYPLAAMVGRDSLRDAAKSVFVTGSFYTQAVPIAAAIATLTEIEANDVIPALEQSGKRLCDGLIERGKAAGFKLTIGGPPAMPFMSFADDDGGFERSRTFAAACARGGVILHPAHNWFVSAAHTEADIDEALAAAEAAFAEVRAAY